MRQCFASLNGEFASRMRLANIAPRNKLRNHDVLSVQAKQRKEKEKQITDW